MRYGVWATFGNKGGPLFFHIDKDNIEEAYACGIEMFDKAQRILVSIPVDNDE